MMLTACNISLSLGGARILRDVNAVFEPGQLSAIVGPNGAGKSTLLNCLAALQMPDTGEIALDFEPVSDMLPQMRARAIGYLPQVHDVHWDIDVRSLVALGRFPHRGAFAGESDADRTAIEDAMTSMDVKGFAGRSVNSLSGGERARVMVARVLAGQPNWLLVDEPLSNLDIGHQLEMLSALLAAAHEGGMGVVMVLHDLSHAMNVADNVLMLDKGKVAATGAPSTALSIEHIERVYGISAQWLDTPDGRRILHSRPQR